MLHAQLQEPACCSGRNPGETGHVSTSQEGVQPLALGGEQAHASGVVWGQFWIVMG